MLATEKSKRKRKTLNWKQCDTSKYNDVFETARKKSDYSQICIFETARKIQK